MHSINWWNQNHLGAPRGLFCVEGGEELHICLFKKVPLSNTFFIIRLRNSHNDECHKLMKSEILGYKGNPRKYHGPQWFFGLTGSFMSTAWLKNQCKETKSPCDWMSPLNTNCSGFVFVFCFSLIYLHLSCQQVGLRLIYPPDEPSDRCAMHWGNTRVPRPC